MLKVTLVKSLIGNTPRNRATVHALGLRKIGQSNTFEDTPAIRGMIHATKHLLQVEENVEGTKVRRRRDGKALAEKRRQNAAIAPAAKPKAEKPKAEPKKKAVKTAKPAAKAEAKAPAKAKSESKAPAKKAATKSESKAAPKGEAKTKTAAKKPAAKSTTKKTK